MRLMLNPNHISRILLYATVIVLNLVVLYCMWPYSVAVFGAFIMLVLFRKLHDRIARKTNHPRLSSVMTCLVSFFVITVPMGILIFVFSAAIPKFIQTARQAYVSLQHSNTMTFKVAGMQTTLDISKIVGQGIERVTSDLGTSMLTLAGNVGHFLINVALMYVLLYYLFIHYPRLYKQLETWAPVPPEKIHALTAETDRVVRSTVYASGIMAFVQGSILTAGYWLLGVPSAILLGILTMVFAFVPVVGSALVWLPTALVLFLSGKPQAAISVLVLGGVIVSNIDNVLRPLIQNRLGEIHPLMSIVGVIVGLPLFGVIGLVIGPVLVFLCLELTRLILNGNTKEA